MSCLLAESPVYLALTGLLVLVSVFTAVVYVLLLKAQIDPLVTVEVRADPQRQTIMLLVIQNIGRGVADDVRFAFSKRLPGQVIGMEPPFKPPAWMSSGPLIDGIPALGPGASRVIVWGQYPALKEALRAGGITATVKFRGRNWLGSAGAAEFEVECPLELDSFAGTDAADLDWTQRGAKALERIAKVMEQNAKR